MSSFPIPILAGNSKLKKCRFNNVVVINGSNPDYINTKMEDHSWYVGNMDRDSANAELEDFPQVGALNDRLRDYSQESCQVFLDELSEKNNDDFAFKIV